LFCSNFLNLNKLNGQCQADFSAPDTVCFKDTVFFTNNSTAGQPEYQWDFGDVLSGTNNTDTVSEPFHLFSEPGTYQVRLIVSDTGNCIDTFYKNIIVLSLPSTTFTISNPCQNLNTLFNYTGSIDFMDALYRIIWNFGSGQDDTGISISRLFSSTDSINVSMKIETLNGCIASKDSIFRIFPEPVISKDKDSVCTGTTIMFAVNTGGATPNIYQWNLGDGNATQGATPLHTYDSSGMFYPRVELTYSNGAKCLSKPDSVFIASTPEIDFYVPDSVQCFKGNEICVHIRNQPDGILYRNIVFDDGHQDVSFNPTDSIICHQYKDTQGGIYSITVEIVDKYQCSNIKTLNNNVKIHQILNADFDIEILNSCFKTDILITNLSNQAPSKVTSYYWDMGDNTILTNNWTNFNHSYSVNGSFDIKLWLENDLGCIDSLIKPSAVTNTIFIVDAKVDSMVGHCFNDNRIYMSQTPIPGGTIFWNFGSNYDGIWNITRNYITPGIYYPRATVRYGDCDSTVYLDTIEIFGPQAIIGNVDNRYQCQIHEEVRVYDGTRYYGNDSRIYFWDFGDAFAPQCTTVTKENKNVNMNCNYSRDSVTMHAHSYKPGEEDCYRVRLYVSDTIVRCSSNAFIDLPLMPPNAKPDPPSLGLYQSRIPQCLGRESGLNKTIVLGLDQTEPPCGRARHWVMWDSLCAAQSGNFDSYWQQNTISKTYSYDDKPCDPNGWVTVGLIIENGNDSNGMICRDTAWYHNFMRFSRLDPRFTIDKAQPQVCIGTTVGFSMIDSLQDSIVSMEWRFENTVYTNINNSTRYHTFNTPGEYDVRLTITNAAGCTGYHVIRIRVGVFPDIEIPKYNVCVDEEVQFNERIRYWSGGYGFWRSAARKAAGKETVLWDFGDGGGFVDVGPTPKHKYSNVGNYTIRIAFRDSLGCWDTLTHPAPVRVHGAFANFSTTKDTFFCAQTVAFTGQGSVIDPVTNYGQSGDQITNYLWQFSPNLPTSSIQNPFRFLQPGSYDVKLTVTNTLGCKGDITKPVVIVGPRTKFSFAYDSSGCSPLEVVFTNETQDANLFIWQFKDLQNNTFTTLSDSQVRFIYNDPGKFYPMLIARGQFNANGINVTCETTYPDTSNNQRKEVTVFPLPNADFTHVTNCVSRQVNFSNTSTVSSGSVQSYHWFFGDGNSSTNQNPSHTYADTGRYNVMMIATTNLGCDDTIRRTIVIAPSPIIMFSFQSSCFGQNTLFFDSSEGFNDIILDWRWNFGDGTSSTLKNPTKLYNSAQTFQVTMSAMNSAGCRDSVTRNVRVHPLPTADFNMSSSCKNSPLYLNSNSTSTDLPLTYLWNFGDGTTSTNNPVVKSYANPGNYNIRLRVESPYGCRDSITKTNTIYPNVNTALSVNQRQQCVNENRFEFKDESTIVSGTYSRLWRFGDGSSSTDPEPVKSYTSPGTYLINLITLSDQGCRDTLVDSVLVFSSPQADFTINRVEQCLSGNQFIFTDQTSSFETHTRNWSLGDGSGSTSGVVNHNYQDTGIFTVRLIATTISGCRDTIEKNIRVLPMPVLDFNINNDQQCLFGNVFSFQNITTISWGNLAYQWNFGDQTGNSQHSPSKTYADFGNYNVKLIATSTYGCRDSITKQVIVHPMPAPGFTINDSDQCVNTNNFVFTNQSTISSGGNMSYNWKFGDGNTAVGSNTSHRYALHNSYRVWMSAESNRGCIDSTFKDLIVYPKPLTNIIPNDTNQCLNINRYQFNTNRSIAYGNLVSYQWNLGNGFNYGTTDTSTVFTTHGSKLIRFVAESNFGCFDTSQLQLIVHPQPNAIFNINDSAQCVNDNDFRFINSSNVSSGSLRYFWQFGDGSTDSSMSPSHTYTAHDTLTVTLFAISNFNCTDTTDRTAIVWPKPYPWFIYNDSGQCLSVNYYEFTNQSTIDYGTLSYWWDLDESITSTATDTQVIYDTHSPKVVSLIAISDNGCRDTVSREIEVYPMPLPEFLINDTAQCLNFQSFEFSNQSMIDYGEVSYYWDFGDGQGSTDESPEHVYQQIGYYRVTLHASSGLNCRDSISDTVRVLAIPEPKYLTNDSEQCINVQDYIFTDNSTIKEGQNVDQYWTFGLDDKDTGLIVGHYFQTSGFFRIKLEVLSDRGCMDSVFGLVRVYPKPIASFEVNDSAQCLYQNDYEFRNTSFDSLGIAFHYWNVNGQSSYNTPDAGFIFADSGYKQINLQVQSIVGCRDTFERTIYVKPMPDPVFDSLKAYYCNNEEPWEMISNTPGGQFFGKNVDGNFFVPETLWRDTVFHRVTVNGCTDSSYQYTQVYPHPEVELVPDTQLCLRDYIEYDVSFWNSRYLWSTKHADSRIIINTPGFYWVDVTNLCGTVRGETNIRYFDHNCRFFMPNAFSPNADDLNERFKPVVTDVREMVYEIYNRWGEIVYKGYLHDEGWDGTFMGKPSMQGVYVVVVRYVYDLKDGRQAIENERGVLHLMR
jgi:gliding motility-associated-like protein